MTGVLTPPILASARLELKAFAEPDAPALHAFFNEPLVRRYLWDDQPVSEPTVREQIAWSQHAFAENGLGHFTLRLAEDRERVCGFAGLRPFGEPPRVELLYGMEPGLWGRGLASEAARAVLGYGFERLGLDEIFAGADPPNAASFRVMQRLGMAWAFDAELDGKPARYYRLDRRGFDPVGSGHPPPRAAPAQQRDIQDDGPQATARSSAGRRS
jgi:ribosomal-protein-alanine N-acetyltransferase